MTYYLLFLALMSVIAFLFYASDKRRAKRGHRRISERTLLCLGVFGGATGALLAMYAVRHKTRHFYFYLINGLALLLQAVLCMCFL